jgi:hypothetical protein
MILGDLTYQEMAGNLRFVRDPELTACLNSISQRLISGDSQNRLVFRSAAAFVRFSLDGKKLFVLSNDQTAHAFDAEKLKVSSSAARQ